MGCFVRSNWQGEIFGVKLYESEKSCMRVTTVYIIREGACIWMKHLDCNLWTPNQNPSLFFNNWFWCKANQYSLSYPAKRKGYIIYTIITSTNGAKNNLLSWFYYMNITTHNKVTHINDKMICLKNYNWIKLPASALCWCGLALEGTKNFLSCVVGLMFI